MELGKSRRPAQVRRRPPSTGKPAPTRIQPRGSIAGRSWRATSAQSPDRSGLPLVAKLVLALAVLALVGAVLLAGTGLLGRTVAGIGSSLAGFLGATPDPSPSPSVVPLPDAPSFALPGTTFTNQLTVDLSGSVPASVAGRAGYSVVVYGGLRGETPIELGRAAVGGTTVFSITAVPVRVGVNVLSARIEGPNGRSPSSPAIRVVVDRKPPTIIIRSPKSGATVNASTVTITGKTQGSSSLVARNESTGQSMSGTAATDGSFELTVGIGNGTNSITIQSTDPAGNVGSARLQVVRGSGALEARMSATATRIHASGLPADVTFRVLVNDPDGAPLAGATVTFSVSVPGIPTQSQDVTTGADGRAEYTMTIPAGATPGYGLATALVTTDQYGETSAKVAFSIIE